MVFTKSSLKSVDFKTLTEGDVANATLNSFRYQSGYAFATVVADNQSVSCIIGKQDEYRIKDLIELKGIEVQVTYLGTKVVNGVTYPRYALQF